MAAGRHPSDEDRARAALGVLERCLEAVRARDPAALAACYAEDAVWLEADGTRAGREACAAAHLELATRASEWEAPQQHGAKAVLRWRGGDGASGAVVVEVRRELLIFAAVA